MKSICFPVIFLAIITLLAKQVKSQNTPFGFYNHDVPVNVGASSDVFVTARKIDKSYLNLADGSPFLTEKYVSAFLKTKSGTIIKSIPVMFDMFNNEFFIENNGQLLAIADIDSLSYQNAGNTPGFDSMIFKTGYPAVNGKTRETIYQIIARRDKLQLLKYYDCRIQSSKEMGLPSKKNFVTQAQYFIYKPGQNKMEQVKLNKKFIDALSDYPKALEIANSMAINYKSESDLVRLVNAL